MSDLPLLRKELTGPIIPGINPVTHSVEDIMKSYFREIIFLAKKFVRPTIDLEDLVTEGIIGLLDAVKRFDPTRSEGPKAFHNLAVLRIKSQMYEYYLANNSSYHIPNYMARLISLVEQIKTLLASVEYSGNPEEELRSSSESEELIQLIPEETLARIRYLKDRIRSIAKNSESNYEDMVGTVLKLEADAESAAFQDEAGVESPEKYVSDKEILEKLFETLKPDAQEVLLRRLEGETLTEVGAEKGVTRERARQIQEETLTWFRGTRMYKQATED